MTDVRAEVAQRLLAPHGGQHTFAIISDDKRGMATQPAALQDLVELEAAIQDLGGELTPGQQAKLDAALEPVKRWREDLRAAMATRHTRPHAGQIAALRPALATRVMRPGRNEPCWCGSSKKYKRCHLTGDEHERVTTATSP